MPADRMFIVAGPPGGGKSSLFSLSDLPITYSMRMTGRRN